MIGYSSPSASLASLTSKRTKPTHEGRNRPRSANERD